MSWFKRNPLGPIRVPAGKAGDDFIDWICEHVWGISREEALENGRRAMRTLIHHGPIIPRPMKAPVGAIFFGLDEEGIERAKVKREQDYTDGCLRIAQRIFDCDDPEHVKEVSIRHYYATRQILELASAWIERAAQIAPELQDRHLEDVRWGFRTVLEEADQDLSERVKRMVTDG